MMPRVTRSTMKKAANATAAASSTSTSSPPVNNYLFFYHAADGPDRPYARFSHFYRSPFVDPDHPTITFPTVEHYMMWNKAMAFDPDAAPAILAAPVPLAAKRLGRAVQNFDVKKWNKIADGVVEKGNYLKYSQNPAFWDLLKTTDGRFLVEASPTDRIWGIGFSADKALANEARWGTNRMGKALNRVRERLLEELGDE